MWINNYFLSVPHLKAQPKSLCTLIVVERKQNKDCLSIFACSKDWGLARQFELYPEMDTLGVKWHPKSDLIAVYSTKLQCVTCVYALDGRCLFIYQPQEIGISLASIAWSKCGNILAVATSQSLAIINTLTWAMIRYVQKLWMHEKLLLRFV